MSKDDRDAIELTEEEYSEFIASIEDFEDKFLTLLAGTERYEIVSAINEEGRPYSKEQLVLIKKECLRLGIKLLYKIDISGTVYILFNPETMKIGYVSETVH